MANMQNSQPSKIPVLADPCATCPYRKDTPSGVWAKEEYDKLPAWDGREFHEANTTIFLCHSADIGGRKAACRGWMEVHCDNIGVRITTMTRLEHNGIPTKVPLHQTGAHARRAGLRGIKQPSIKARLAIGKLLKARANKNQERNIR